ncbi:pilus assembly protein [Burkholderiaceae bacterium FT117]|uniref:TadE/TadG family type IV pilus assembly protein n=1 Tax=Zeimonas sediminis TaxID=2944268 RepID=UPI00234312E4|nr:TadE/TadG family type IV pilus assembly protein [Zeimonas sediminis]MCM5572012.1 pilus assembly protein [Zeimonas sediminis]
MTIARRRPPEGRSGRAGGRPSARTQRGASAIEFAIAAPVVLMLGLGALQWALVFHARQSIEHAAIEAGRAGSVGNALPDAIETGLARGLLPYWSTLPEIRAIPDRQAATAAARNRLRQGRASGWIVVRRLSPTRESFADWAEAALDGWGRPLPGLLEIPNDNLQFAEQRSPNGGAAGTHLGLPVGRASGQTLVDANLLKLEIVYGVPMTVPLVGRIAALAGRMAGGCLSAERGGCAIFTAPDSSGRPVPRWPVATMATIRMQSPARQAADAPSRASLPQGTRFAGSIGAGAGAGSGAGGGTNAAGGTETPSTGAVSGPAAFRPPAGSPGDSYGGIDAASDGSLARPDSGWLSLGGESLFSVPGACVAP